MTEQSPVLQAYIENTNDSAIGGFTIPLPTTTEKLWPWLEAIEADGSGRNIAVWEVRSDLPWLQEALSDMEEAFGLEELNFLAQKVAMLEDPDRAILSAALEADRHCGNVAELINLTENLNCLYLQPAFSEEQYGEFLVDDAKDNTVEAFERLEHSSDSKDRELAQYILRLEAHVDHAAYGRAAAEQEGGSFTPQGYLTQEKDLPTIYRGPEDIPKESRLFVPPEPVFLKTEAIDLTEFLMKAHALGGDFLSDAQRNMGTLEARRSAESLMLMSDRHIVLTEAAHPYRYESDQFHDFTVATEFIHAKAFALHVKGWRMVYKKIKALENDNRLYLEGDSLRVKDYWNERKNPGKRIDTLWNDLPENSSASKELEKIFMQRELFDNPKPTELIKRCFDIGPKNAIVLDFFAGSGTAGQAALELNNSDGGNREFILIQNNEVTDKNPNGIAYDITAKRLKRVMTGSCYDGTNSFEWIKDHTPLGDNLDVYEIAEVANFEAAEGKTPFDVIDETLYGVEKFATIQEKVEWVCNNFEATQKQLEEN